MDMIGQRLYTGRVAVAQAALTFGRGLFQSTREYSDAKKCWAPKGDEPNLSSIPQLVALYQEGDASFSKLEAFVGRAEKDLCACLRADNIPPKVLVESIAVAKVRSVEDTISLCFRLKQDVGSFALMSGTGFEQMDFLQCCKFAEGDSRVLMQKMSRDRLKSFKKDKAGSEHEHRLINDLTQAMQTGGPTAWNDNWRTVYDLATVIMERTMQAGLAKL